MHQSSPEFRHLSYFLMVAETLNFRQAAENLFISQPGLSRQIQQLEQNLGVTLFNRTKRRVSLTPAGHYLRKEALQVQNHMDRIRRNIGLIEKGEEGEIRIGFVGSAMQEVIPELLISLNERFPGIHTSLYELSNAHQVEALLRDELDIGFVRFNRVPEPLTLREVMVDTFSLVLPTQHPLASEDFQGMEQLAGEAFILFERNYSPEYYDQVMSICEDVGFSPRISHRSVHANTIFRLVSSGLGVSIVPTTLREGFDLPVRFIELTDNPQRAILSAVWRTDSQQPTLRSFLSLLEDHKA